MSKPPLVLHQLFAYGLMALPLSFVGLPLYIYVPDLYTTQKGIGLTLMGMILMAIRLFDAVQDPLIGICSDRFSKHRLLIMALSFVLFIASFFLLYHPMGNAKLWMIVMMVLATTAYSVLSINLNAIGSLWSRNPSEKTRIVSVRESIGVIGLLFAVMLLPLINFIAPQANAYHLYAVVAFAINVFAGIFFFKWFLKNRYQFNEERIKSSIKLNVLLVPSVRIFYGIYGVSALASSIPAVLVLFFIRDRIGAEHLTGLFLLIYFVAASAGMPFWRKLADRKTKRFSWLVAMIIACGSFVWAFFLGNGDVVSYGVICLISGFAFGAELILPPSILSDLIDQKNHQQETSSYFAFMALWSKLSLALASGLGLIMLGSTDFVPAMQNNPHSLFVLSVAYAVVPCVIKLVSIIVLIYWIRKESNNEIQINSSLDRITSHA
jgi:glycoside/pentoside/hexuronide:cation symporter, GPH family